MAFPREVGTDITIRTGTSNRRRTRTTAKTIRRRARHTEGGILLLTRSSTSVERCLISDLSSRCGMITIPSNKGTLRATERVGPSVVVSSVIVPMLRNSRLYQVLGSSMRADRVPVVLLATLDRERGVVFKLRTNTGSCVVGPFSLSILGIHVEGVLRGERRLHRAILTVSTRPRRASCADRLSGRFLSGIVGIVRRRLSSSRFSVGSFYQVLNVDHASICGGVGALAKRKPGSFVHVIHLGGTGRLLISQGCSVKRITGVIKFSSPGCFDAYFGGRFNADPDGV